jgi:MFS family permease
VAADPPTREPSLGPARTAFLLATVFASGAAVMIVEMTAVRALQPFFGSTTFVWTNVIAVVLAALALGYGLGGRLADRWPQPRLLYGLLGAGGLLLVLCAFAATPVSRLFLEDGLDLEGAPSVLLRGSLGATMLLFAPPILLLGMVSPLAIRLLARDGVGRAAGSVFALSTLGSILGTYLPALLLVPAVGSRGSILVAAAILLAAAATGFFLFGGRPWGLVPVGLLVAAGATGSVAARGVLPARPAPPLGRGGAARVLAEVESPYQYLTVRDDAFPADGTARVLTINEGVYTYHALRVDARVLTGSRYYDAYSVVPFLLDREPGARLSGCVVGMACGVNASQWHHFWSPVYDLWVDGAEIDPAVIELGRAWFGLPGPEVAWLRTVAMDGRQMLEAVGEGTRYDVIVVDAFTNELYVPFHLATREFFTLCRRRLVGDGILAMNVYALGSDPPNLVAVENTLATVFGRCWRIRQHEGGSHLLLAAAGATPPDLGRLGAEAIRARSARWADSERWTRTAEWDDLVRLADELGRAPEAGLARLVLPERARRVLTDDHAPLEWLTDRFLDRTEARSRAEEPGWDEAITRLAGRQRRFLAAIALGWALVLLPVVWRVRRDDARGASRDL